MREIYSPQPGQDLSRKHNNIDSITYEYAMRGCSIENPNTKSQITYGWVNGNKRSLQTNPGTNTSVKYDLNL